MCMFEVLKLIWVKWIGGSRLSLMVTIWGVAFYSLLLSIDIYPFIHTCIHLTMLGSAQGGIGLIECFVVLALAVEHLNYSVQTKNMAAGPITTLIWMTFLSTVSSTLPFTRLRPSAPLVPYACGHSLFPPALLSYPHMAPHNCFS